MLKSNVEHNSRGVNSFSGKRAWTLGRGTLKSKLIDSGYYFGVFAGVALISHSMLMDISTLAVLVFFIGLLLTPVTVIWKSRHLGYKITYLDETNKPQNKRFKQVISLMSSTLGAGLTLGSWLLLFYQQDTNFWMYLLVGVVLSFLSRYKLGKNSFLGIIEDYSMYITSFNGVVITSYGFSIIMESWLLAIVLVIVGLLVTPTMLIMREKTVFKRKSINPTRKYFAIVAVILGVSLAIAGVVNIANGSILSVLLIPEGCIFIIGGCIFNQDRTLMSLKDIV